MSSKPKVSVEELLERNKQISATHVPKPNQVWKRTGGRIAVDRRANPEEFLGLSPGEIVVLRNAGGRAYRALGDIMILDSLLGFSDILVVQHNDCGLSHLSDAHIKDDLKARLPENAEIESMRFGEKKDDIEDIREDVRFLKTTPYLRAELADKVRGFFYDIKKGSLTEVEG